MLGTYRLAATILLLALFLESGLGNLMVSLSTRHDRTGGAVKLISFCIDCPAPDSEGSAAHALLPKHGMQDFHVIGELVYCVPNFAESKRVMNPHQFINRIVLVDRGRIPILEKLQKIMLTDASGIIIADDGRCNDEFTFCGHRAGSAAEGGFSPYDSEELWNDLEIPVMMVSVRTADTIRRMMGFNKVEIPRLGLHNVTAFNDGSDEL
ncbi:hypothetical protein B484DRAFT_448933 [Ochromonadaceae sp. CCMP2298]|nr:hypothetical protein B484DRAFT_448933 [Ochromonadaceae sp. CCMP2298]|mmetsp:Transcript_31174/g.68768  ORF Transcript_31174/g.68768 Transcript_31174/m.68768 type:complete len:209 (-) Transcript_31174:153-779(-)